MKSEWPSMPLEELCEFHNGLWKGKNNESVWSSQVEIGGTPYYLAAVGGVEAARRAAIDAMPTCERILAA